MAQPPGCRRRSLKPAALLIPALLMAAAGGCRSDRAVRVISAEFLDDKNHDGVPRAGETIRITLDRPLPSGFRPESVRVRCGPPAAPLLVRVDAGVKPGKVLDLVLLSTPVSWLLPGSFSGDPGAREGPTGLGIDLGAGMLGEQWVDLQELRSPPVLVHAIWEDRPVPGAPWGNLIVDQSDRIVLVFDREVRLASGPEPLEPPPVPAIPSAQASESPRRLRVEVPADILLAKPDDQLDDGTVPSVFEEGDQDHPREVRIVLGSNPRLTIAGRHRPAQRGQERERAAPFWPSGIAVNGTAVQPLQKIVDRRGWPGAISRGSVDIEFRSNYFFFEKLIDESFPPLEEEDELPGARTFHTVTPVAGGRALVIGGMGADGQATGQVLLFNPEAPQPFTVVGEMREARYLHTATLCPGDDGLLGTFDDVVVVAGGTDGRRSLDTLVAVRLDPTALDRVSVKVLPSALKVPRMFHTASFIPPDRLLVDGGRYSAPSGGGGIVPTAEVLYLPTREGKSPPRDGLTFRTIPRDHHSSTYLGQGKAGAHYVFNHGGFGLPRDRDPGQTFYSSDEGVVLAAPSLTRIEGSSSEGGRDGSTAPAGVSIPLDFEYRYEMMRYDHRAAPIGFDPYAGRALGVREVLIAGGSLQPPNYDPLRPKRSLFEQPQKPEDVARLTREPTYTECASALVFEFQPAEPEKSSLRVVESPTGDRRIHFGLVPLGQAGLLILGGENPVSADDVYQTSEIYLPRERRLAPLAVPLAVSRTRFGAFASDWQGSTTIYLLGGSTPAAEAAGFADVERLRLEPR